MNVELMRRVLVDSTNNISLGPNIQCETPKIYRHISDTTCGMLNYVHNA